MHSQISSNKERASSNTFEGDSDLNTEVEQILNDEEEAKTALGVEITDHDVDQLLSDEPEVIGDGNQGNEDVAQEEVAQNEVVREGNRGGEEVA